MQRILLAVRLDRSLEKKVLRTAAAVITVSPSIVRLLQRKVENCYFVLPNGFDSSDFAQSRNNGPENKFTLVHTGHLAVTQNPLVLWETLAAMLRSSTEYHKTLMLHFYGNVQPEVIRSLEVYNLKNYCTFHDYTPHSEVVTVMENASLLFFVVPKCTHNEGILTSKLFDYFGAQRPVLGIGPANGDAAAILNETKVGSMYDYGDSEGVSRFIRNLFETWKKQGSTRLETAEGVAQFSRQNLTRKLSGIFDSLSQKSSEKITEI